MRDKITPTVAHATEVEFHAYFLPVQVRWRLNNFYDQRGRDEAPRAIASGDNAPGPFFESGLVHRAVFPQIHLCLDRLLES